MGAPAYLLELQNKHAKLDAKIKQEMRSPVPDSLRISSLKKQKLQLKEQMAQASAV